MLYEVTIYFILLTQTSSEQIVLIQYMHLWSGLYMVSYCIIEILFWTALYTVTIYFTYRLSYYTHNLFSSCDI